MLFNYLALDWRKKCNIHTSKCLTLFQSDPWRGKRMPHTSSDCLCHQLWVQTVMSPFLWHMVNKTYHNGNLSYNHFLYIHLVRNHITVCSCLIKYWQVWCPLFSNLLLYVCFRLETRSSVEFWFRLALSIDVFLRNLDVGLKTLVFSSSCAIMMTCNV